MLRDNLLAISNKKLLLVVIGFFSVYFPFAQTHSIHFDHFLLGDGVHVNTVYEILQDRQGFMWFGTLDGLVLYDGYHFKYYRYDPEGESRIKGTRINGLLEDRSGNIWIIAGQRLQVLDQKLDSFYTFTDLDGDSLIFYSYAKYNEILLQDSSDHIWLGSRRGLFRIQERQNDPPYEVKY